MNSLPDIEEVKDKSIKKGNNAFRVYRMLPLSERPSKKGRGESLSTWNAVEGIVLRKTPIAGSSVCNKPPMQAAHGALAGWEMSGT